MGQFEAPRAHLRPDPRFSNGRDALHAEAKKTLFTGHQSAVTNRKSRSYPPRRTPPSPAQALSPFISVASHSRNRRLAYLGRFRSPTRISLAFSLQACYQMCNLQLTITIIEPVRRPASICIQDTLGPSEVISPMRNLQKRILRDQTGQSTLLRPSDSAKSNRQPRRLEMALNAFRLNNNLRSNRQIAAFLYCAIFPDFLSTPARPGSQSLSRFERAHPTIQTPSGEGLSVASSGILNRNRGGLISCASY